MTKLKTLKDISFPRQGGNCYRVEGLKQEAIKWVKNWQKEKITGRRQESGTYQYHRNMKINLFKDFFNITEEDLK